MRVGGAVITLVIGGARSGKSGVAERLATGHGPPVTYVATLAVGCDVDLAARVEAHRVRRPTDWATLEAPVGDPDALPEVLRSITGTMVVDSLGPWVSGAPGMVVDVDDLCAALTGRHGDTVVVSEEVGMGVHPASDAGRAFRDALGSLNQAVATVADNVVLVVAGRLLRLEPEER
jgi:adenosyl cobinamide kinase/adenosyl cobinamide phosphate guanylyltransferase